MARDLGQCGEPCTVSELLSRHRYNFEVSKNREMLKHHVRAVFFLVSQGLALRGHNETKASTNRGNYVQLVEEFSRFSCNEKMERILKEDNPTFSGLSPDIQNDIVQCLYNHLMLEIKARVQNAPYVSIMADETTDVSNTSQLAVSLRFVFEGKVYEHLIDVVDVSADRTATAIATQIKDSLSSCVGVDEKSNVIGQSYDGAANMSGRHRSVQTILRETWPRASFVHCYAHKWALVARKVCDTIPTVSLFFGFIQSLCNFFRASPKRACLLSNVLPGSCPTRWLTKGKSVTAVENKLAEIENVLQSIASGASGYDSTAKSEATGLLYQMGQTNNLFLLKVFKRIFCLSDVMTRLLQERNIDAMTVSTKIQDYHKLLKSMRSDETFAEIWTAVKAFNTKTPRQRKPPGKLSMDSGYKDSPGSELGVECKLKALLFEILDTLCSELLSRFEDIEKFQWMSLLHPDNFDKMQADPQRVRLLINGVKSVCPSLVPDSEAFFSQLKILYGDSQLRAATKDARDFATLLQVLHSLDLTKALPGISNALVFCLTTAITSVACERSFSVLKRVKNYCRSTMGPERTKHVMMLGVESELMTELSVDVAFCDKIIDMFAAMKQRRINLVFRQ